MPTPAVLENAAVRLGPTRWVLVAIAAGAGLVGALASSTLSWGVAGLLSGLSLVAWCFHPRSGIGPRSMRRRSRHPSPLLRWAWPAAVLLDLWIAAGVVWILLGLWSLLPHGIS